MQDRFVRGFLAGVISGIPTLIISIIAFYFKLTTIQWAHFTSVFLYGRVFQNFTEQMFAAFTTFIFCGLLGILLAYLIPKFSSNNYYFKSLLFGISIWFFSFVVRILFKVPQLQYAPLKTTIINFIMASVWGLMLGYTLKWFDSMLKTS